jgi:carbon monoxide dehydrogenase subunit G
MGIPFQQSFVVKAPPDRVWAFLVDPYRIAGALPGAAITEKVDDATYKGTITVKVGPVSARYRGTIRFAKLDPVAREAEVTGTGQEATGRGGADMKMNSSLREIAPGETEVQVTSEVNVTGILAQMGRGMIQDVSNQMFQKFTAAARAELEKPAEETAAAASVAGGSGAPAAAVAPASSIPSTPPIEVVSFGGKIAGRALARAAGRPAFWVVAAVLLLLLYWLSKR